MNDDDEDDDNEYNDDDDNYDMNDVETMLRGNSFVGESEGYCFFQTMPQNSRS